MRATVPSTIAPRQDIDQLGDLAALLALVARRNRMRHARCRMVAEDLLLDRTQRRPHRRDLGDDVDAVAVILDHAAEPAHLALDPLQALENRGLGICSHAAILP